MSWFIVSVPSKEHEQRSHPFRGNENNGQQPNGNVRNPRYIVQVPEEQESKKKKDEPPLEKILEDTLQELGITDAVWASDRNGTHYQVYFPSEPGLEDDRFLRTLVDRGFGVRSGSTVGIVPCTVFYRDEDLSGEDFTDDDSFTDPAVTKHDEKKGFKAFKALQKDFLKSVTARLTVAQVVEKVRNDGAVLSFDFLLFATVASMVAALGLLENSSVNIVASMLISPIMGPIMAVTFGIMIRDRKLVTDGIKTEVCGLGLCLLSGFIFGVICGNFKWGTGVLPTAEQIARGQYRSLWVGVLVALPSGAGVALSVLGGNHASLVGVAISASLLPPAVNCGILWGLSVLNYCKALSETPVLYNITQTLANGTLETIFFDLPPSLYRPDFNSNYFRRLDWEYATLGIFSLLLTAVNIACIILAAVVVLKVKEVAPYTSVRKTERFWKHDVKIARDYNRTIGNQEGDIMGTQVLQEWAKLTGLDPSQVMGDSEEARMTRLQTMKDIVQDVEGDEVYRTVLKCMGGPRPGPLEGSGILNAAVGETSTDATTPVWDLDYTGNRRLSHMPSQDRWRRKLSKAPAVATISQDVEIPGVETHQLPPPEQRSRMLRRSLAHIDNPYTLWPRRPSTIADGTRPTRRVSTAVPRFVVTPADDRRRSRFSPPPSYTDFTQL